MRIGVYGGSFDPIHQGHLILAEYVRENLSLDKILFIPAAISPHKTRHQVTPAPLRLKMVELAIADNPYFQFSDIEIKRGGISYTVETIKTLREDYSLRQDQLLLLIGSDNLLDLPKWKEPERLLALCQVAVLPRPGFDIEEAEERFRKRVLVLQTPLIEISSQQIRRRVKQGKSIKYLVPPSVERFIKEKGLYR